MKLASIIFGLLAFNQASASVLAPIEDLFIPNGFDSNDSAEVIVSGYLPNPCYSRPEISVRRNANAIEISVTTGLRSGTAPDYVCAEVVVPFLESVNLGTLAAGTYNLSVNRQLRMVQGKLKVTPAAVNSVDEHIYALVEYVEKDVVGRHFFINGYNYSDCLELDRVEFLDNGADTISVMPIMKKVRDLCPRKMIPFRYEIHPDFSNVNSDKVLLHVRTPDGKAVNSLLDFTGVLQNNK